MQGSFKKKLRSIGKKILIALIWLSVWQAVYMLVGQELLVASPVGTLNRIIELAATSQFWSTVMLSMLRIFIGFAIAVVSGALLAVLTAASSFLYSLFSPVIKIIRATPVTSFIMLALIWLGAPNVPSFTSFLMVLPIIWANVTEGINTVSPQLIEMSKIYSFTRCQKLRLIYIPNIMPFFSAAMTTGLGLAWKAGIAAEVLGRPPFAIGTEIYNSKIYLNTADMFAWTAVVILLSMLFEYAFVILLRRVTLRRFRGGKSVAGK